ncbi:tRNA dimethylallyltransferase [Parasphingorhabdus marina DSM 22363]|uniref:tRNA dimethylallyltransferase n=1 Tax=Parasphingorhabdus marina DSM 22363 TaxID=1123272 RepID=A0A1N6FES0_9SPHN|nr:tRNA (adenosine(37)-N6)-dimethylallyltransferase MiaA [Parasphingorhabdus marina]SIN93757.1 tRNA dimethylallyltransferase [Parasphingorhabdus marina DSM 22363]
MVSPDGPDPVDPGPDNIGKVALIVGPTASGKSALALELAKKQPSIIINADSAQVYADLQILSARPTADEMGDIPHSLYGYIDGAEACSAARWAADAKAEIREAHAAGRMPILVGGTGLYVRTLLDGIAPIPEIDPKIRHEIRNMDTMDAYDTLQAEDEVSADRLNPRDSSRIKRALEVVRSTGHALDHWHRHLEGGIADQIQLKPLVLLPDRDWLYERCDLRFEQMWDDGAVTEVQNLLQRNLPEDCPVMRAIGVPEIRQFLDGHMTREEAIAEACTATRRYAKRQYTWFRNQTPDDWPRWKSNISSANINDIVSLLQ